MAQTTALMTAAVLTASGQTAAISTQSLDALTLAEDAQVSIEVTATAVGGTTPSAQFSVLWSDDGSNWASESDTIGAALTAVGSVLGTFPIRGAYLAVAYVITGTTPSFTVSAEAHI